MSDRINLKAREFLSQKLLKRAFQGLPAGKYQRRLNPFKSSWFFALGMAAAQECLRRQSRPQRIIVILSGGNMDKETIHSIWKKNYLSSPPTL